jgi:hypothetical protein
MYFPLTNYDKKPLKDLSRIAICRCGHPRVAHDYGESGGKGKCTFCECARFSWESFTINPDEIIREFLSSNLLTLI